ncbi:MAG: 16S rRNA processing protein RimM [Betaproteobacteria bacterium]|nr:16S rRNA processing protein RimM [Betaproteobacteria bacterium]
MAARPLVADSGRKIIIGRFGAPFGVCGWIHVSAFGGCKSFLQNDSWWCAPGTCDLSAETWRDAAVEDIRIFGENRLAAKLRDIDGRNEAAKWTNGGIAIARENLPQPAEDEYYWCDLIGMRALDMHGGALGKIAGLFRTGAHDVLRIAPEDGGAEILAPFAGGYVEKVDYNEKTVRLNWLREW